MKKLIYVGCFAVLLVAAGACKKSGKDGDIKWKFKDGTLTISGKGDIPDYHSTAPWSEYNKSITTIVIENGITSIGMYAFASCESLTSVSIPNTVTKIRGWAFAWCSSLKSVTIPNSVVIMEGNVFYDCISLSSATAPSSLVSAFSYCINLTSVTISEGVSIEAHAFENCRNLSSVVIPNSVTSIGNYAFLTCKGLVSITNLNPVPVVINSTVFEEEIKSRCTLKVPASSVSAYQNAEVWKEFNIVGM